MVETMRFSSRVDISEPNSIAKAEAEAKTNGITLGTSESDFLAKAGDAKSEKTEKEDSNLTLYTFYSDDEKLDYTEVGIDNDLKLVRSIKVVHNQPETPEEEAEKTSAEDSSSVSDSQEPSETPAP